MKRKMVTTRTWRQYLKSGGPQGMFGYCEATDDMNTKLSNILTKSTTAEQLKENIEALVKNRSNFLHVVNKKWKID